MVVDPLARDREAVVDEVEHRQHSLLAVDDVAGIGEGGAVVDVDDADRHSSRRLRISSCFCSSVHTAPRW
jgi:hypothetical protein